MEGKLECDIFYLACVGRRVREKFGRSADQHGQFLPLITLRANTLLQQYEILEKLVTYIATK